MGPALRVAGAMAIGLALAPPLVAQKNIPATYAITNARLVPVSGPVVEQGTIVVRDGLIAAVGANATVPADARVIDGSGLTVYPGLIDAYTSLGFATPAAAANGAAGGGRGGRGGAVATTSTAPARNSNYPTGLQPEVQAVDLLDPDPTTFEAPHAAGFTTALTAQASGIYRGASALINLRDGDANALVLKSPVTQSVGFSRGGGGFGFGGGGYPGSLMGVFAALRQELYDAIHYRDLTLAYEKNPRGMQRPEYDPSLDALLPVLARTETVVMQANSEREIIRALDLAREFNIRIAIAGGAEAYKVADRLKAEGVPVLLSTNFPERGSGGGGRGGFGGRGGASPDAPEPLEQLRARVEQPKGPNLLAQAGVMFAFEAGNNWTGFLANLRKAVKVGLPPDVALKALTIQPATLFGVADRIGSLEVGKIANLTITKGDLFDSASRVTEVFVDGDPIVIPAAAPSGSGRGGNGSNGGGQ